MARVKRGNRTLRIHDAAVSNYLKQGYDQIDDTGKVLKKATGGRMVTLPEHNKALDEVEKLKTENVKLREEYDLLHKEVDKMKKETKKEGK